MTTSLAAGLPAGTRAGRIVVERKAGRLTLFRRGVLLTGLQSSTTAPAPTDHSPRSVPSMPSLPEIRKALVALALQIAEDDGCHLDFSPGSVRDVEAILGELHDHYLQTKDEDGLFGIALEFGAYLIEVIERHFPPKGEWTRDDPIFGENAFPYQWRAAMLFPVQWCLKRIVDGPEENVEIKFQALVVSHPLQPQPAPR